MRLSEAIRLGAMLRPQEYSVLFDVSTGRSCALGAAAEAIGMLDITETNRFVNGVKAPQAWMWVKRIAACPECGPMFACHYDKRDVQSVIIHLNNQHRWTRERIADWVESIERSQEADTSSRPVDAVARTPDVNESIPVRV